MSVQDTSESGDGVDPVVAAPDLPAPVVPALDLPAPVVLARDLLAPVVPAPDLDAPLPGAMGVSALLPGAMRTLLSSRIAWSLATLPFKVIGGSVDLMIACLRRGGAAAAIVAEALGLSGRRPAPFLPREVVWEIVSKLPPSLQGIKAARSVCKEWRCGVPHPHGPWLVLCRPELAGEEQQFTALQMQVTAGGGQPELVLVPWISRPPLHSTSWGAAHGLLALREMGTNNMYLFCIVCGQSAPLPPLADGAMNPQGYVFNSSAFQSFATLSHGAMDCILHFESVDWEVADPPMWEVYPGTADHALKSVIFTSGRRLYGVTGQNALIISEHGHGNTELFVPLADDDADFHVWENHGINVFKCSDKVYVCVLMRADNGNGTRATVYQVHHDQVAGYSLLRKRDIGSYAVFIGANQAFTLPAIDGSAIQCHNTLYVPNDDGINVKGSVLAINIRTDVVSTVSFPDGVDFNEYSRAAWVAAAHPGGPFFHCHH